MDWRALYAGRALGSHIVTIMTERVITAQWPAATAALRRADKIEIRPAGRAEAVTIGHNLTA